MVVFSSHQKLQIFHTEKSTYFTFYVGHSTRHDIFGSYGSILYKNHNIFDAKISPPKISKRSLWGKTLVDGEMFLKKIRTRIDLLSPSQGVREKKREMSKRLGAITLGCKYKTCSWHSNGFPDSVVILGQQFSLGMVPTKLYLMLFYAGDIQNSKRKGNVFFLTSG